MVGGECPKFWTQLRYGLTQEWSLLTFSLKKKKNKNRFPSYFEPRSREEEQTEGERWASRSGRKYTSSPVAQGTM